MPRCRRESRFKAREWSTCLPRPDVQTHTFISATAEDAVNRIRARLGPNAVVLEVRKLPRTLFRRERFEIVATVDQAASEEDKISELRAEIRDLQREVRSSRDAGSLLHTLLVQSGLLPRFAEPVVESAGPAPPESSVRDQMELLRGTLRQHWRPVADEVFRAHVFIGPAGSGKSTVLCKWLAQHILSENRGAAVYQLDSDAANLSPQPKYFAEILGAHFTRSSHRQFDSEAVFVDLPGLDCGNEKALDAARAALAEFPGAAVHLVLNGAYDASLLLEQARSFAALGPDDLILTHLDEEKRWGKVWNLVLGSSLGIRFLSLGQNVPGGLLGASPDEILARQFGPKTA